MRAESALLSQRKAHLDDRPDRMYDKTEDAENLLFTARAEIRASETKEGIS